MGGVWGGKYSFVGENFRVIVEIFFCSRKKGEKYTFFVYI